MHLKVKSSHPPISVFDIVVQSLLSFSLLLFTFGQLLRIPVGRADGALYIYEILVLAVTVILMAHLRFKPFALLQKNRFEHSILLFLAYTWGTTLLSLFFFSIEQNITAVLYLLRLSMYLLFSIYLIYYTFSVRLMPLVFWTIGLSIVLTVVFSIIQYAYYPDLRNLFYAGWDPHLYRLFGVFFEPVYAAAVYGVFALYLFFQKRYSRAITYPFIAILVIALLATFSRGAYIALAVTTVLYLCTAVRLRWLFVGFAVCIIVVGMLPKPAGEGVNLMRTSTIASRIVDYQQGIELWKSSPVLGIGYNHIRSVKETPMIDKGQPNNAAGSFHSSFLIIMVTTGIIGLFLYLNMLVRLGQMGVFEKYAIIFMAVVSLFDNVLLHPFMLFLFIYLAATVTHPSYK